MRIILASFLSRMMESGKRVAFWSQNRTFGAQQNWIQITELWKVILCKYTLKIISNAGSIFLDPTSWGYCPEHLIPKSSKCSPNYQLVMGVCIRISPYQLNWTEAESKCRSEGAHLAHIQSPEMQREIQLLIKQQKHTKVYFQKKFSKNVREYWIGGTVSN